METIPRPQRPTAIVARVPLLPVDGTVAARYGQLRKATGRAPTGDLWIAATALAPDLEVLTRDHRLAALPLVRARHVP